MYSILVFLKYLFLIIYKTIIIQFANYLIHFILVFIYHFAERIQVIFFSGIENSLCDPFGSGYTFQEEIFEFRRIYFFNGNAMYLKENVKGVI